MAASSAAFSGSRLSHVSKIPFQTSLSLAMIFLPLSLLALLLSLRTRCHLLLLKSNECN